MLYSVYDKTVEVAALKNFGPGAWSIGAKVCIEPQSCPGGAHILRRSFRADGPHDASVLPELITVQSGL